MSQTVKPEGHVARTGGKIEGEIDALLGNDSKVSMVDVVRNNYIIERASKSRGLLPPKRPALFMGLGGTRQAIIKQ